jgi:Bacterial Ig domain/Bacterial cadherin-like domain
VRQKRIHKVLISFWLAVIGLMIVAMDCGGGVTPSNRVPAPVNDTYRVSPGGTLTIATPGVLQNDSDPDGDALTAYMKATPKAGNLSMKIDGGFTYTNTTSATSDSFTYNACDDKDCSEATATINISSDPGGNAPSAVNDAYQVNMGQTLTVDAANGVLKNDSDANGDTLSVIKVSDPSAGTLALNNDGSFAYTNTNNTVTSDSFTYKVNDGASDSNVATVTVTVVKDNPEKNDPPIANEQAVETEQGQALSITLTATDPENAALSYAIVSNPSNGSLGGSAFNLTYTPNSGFNGSDSFTFTATDPGGLSDGATVNITVNALNAPVINQFSVSEPVINSGDDLTFSWNIEGSEPLTIKLIRTNPLTNIQSEEDVSGTSSITLNPSETLKYRLEASNDTGGATNELLPIRVRQGNFRNVANPKPSSVETFLTYASGAEDTAAAYYSAISAESTLGQWIANRKPSGNENEITAQYVNEADLGFGRDMHCWNYATTNYACYVGNYVDVNNGAFTSDAADDFHLMDTGKPVATVAMDYVPSRGTGLTGLAVQFYVYDSNGNRINNLDLDSQGKKSNPQSCLECHGGKYDSSVNMVRGASFLPFDVHAFDYDDALPERLLANQQDAFRQLNQVAFNVIGGSSVDIQGLINLWYQGNLNTPGTTLNTGVAPDNWKSNATNEPNSEFTTWLPETVYFGVYVPYCRMCHLTASSQKRKTNTSSFSTLNSYQTFKAFASTIRGRVCDTGANTVNMPNAEYPFKDFWEHSEGHDRLQVWTLTQLFKANGLSDTSCPPSPF